MKRFFLILTCLIFSFLTLGGCDCNGEEQGLSVYVSQLRYQLYEGKSQNYTLFAEYGYTESPYLADGKIGEKIYVLKFRLPDKQTDQVTYSICLEFNGKTYNQNFALSPNRHALTCEMQIDAFDKKEFTVTIGTDADKESLTLKSVVPNNVLDYKGALKALQKHQAELLNTYRDSEGVFCAEIYARIIVKEDKAYWYIGIASERGSIKALLIDAQNGEVLAIRDVF